MMREITINRRLRPLSNVKYVFDNSSVFVVGAGLENTVWEADHFIKNKVILNFEGKYTPDDPRYNVQWISVLIDNYLVTKMGYFALRRKLLNIRNEMEPISAKLEMVRGAQFIPYQSCNNNWLFAQKIRAVIRKDTVLDV
jgi:hypothetical protein